MKKTFSPEELAKRQSFAALLSSYALIVSIGLLFFWGKSWFLERRLATVKSKASVEATPTPLAPTDESMPVGTECVSENTTVFSDDRLFALCTDGEELAVARKDLTNSAEQYFLLTNKTGQIATGSAVYLSYSDDSNSLLQARQENAGSRVFRYQEGQTPQFEVLLEPENIEPKEDFITGSLYRPQFILPTQLDRWAWSPDGNILLLRVSSCVNCPEPGFLYAYDLVSKQLQLVGQVEQEGGILKGEWAGPRTLKWQAAPGEGEAVVVKEMTFKKTPSPTPLPSP